MLCFLLACATEPADTGGSDPALDSGDTGDTADPDTALQPLERCGNEVDDDQDGSVDEAGCATDWIVGDQEGGDLGLQFFTAGAAEPWVYGRGFGVLTLDDGALHSAWEIFPETEVATSGGFGLAVADGSVWAAYTVREDRDYILMVDDHGATGTEPGEPVRIGDVGSTDRGVSLSPSGEGGVYLLVGTSQVTVGQFLVDPAAPMLDWPMVEYRSTVDYWGAAISLIPDAAGDGLPGVLVNAFSSASSNLYFFSAGLTGVVTEADADGHLLVDLEFGYEPQPTADLDGDGHSELLLHGHPDFVAFGPFIGELVEDDMVGLTGTGVSVQASLDGDEHLDVLAAGGGTGNVYIAHGPIDRSVTSVRDLDYEVLLDGLPEPSGVVAADLDQSGQTWLVVGFGDAGGDAWGAPEDAGAIAAFPAPDGVALP